MKRYRLLGEDERARVGDQLLPTASLYRWEDVVAEVEYPIGNRMVVRRETVIDGGAFDDLLAVCEDILHSKQAMLPEWISKKLDKAISKANFTIWHKNLNGG